MYYSMYSCIVQGHSCNSSFFIYTMLKVKVILGSSREGRHGEKVGLFISELASKRTDWEVEYIDLKERVLPFFTSAKPPKMGDYEEDGTKAWAKTVDEADAFILITPEYNHGYPAVLKNALDLIYKEWNNKPVAFVGYGAAVGGSRAVEQLRQVVVELQMAPIRDAVAVPMVWEAFDEAGKPKNQYLVESGKAMFDQLSWWGEALKQARNK